VWPVGAPLEWTWLEHTFELWDAGWGRGEGGSGGGGGGALANGNRGPFFWREEGALREVRVASQNASITKLTCRSIAAVAVFFMRQSREMFFENND
jgi:hypothetical protein